MEKIFEQYLKNEYNLDYIKIINYDIDGANCSVNFYTDQSHHYKETNNINIWDMFIFLNKQNKTK